MSLSPRQLEVLRGLLNGKSNEQIAKSLGIAVPTVKNHNQVIYRYLGISDRKHLTLIKLQAHGFVMPEKAKGVGA